MQRKDGNMKQNFDAFTKVARLSRFHNRLVGLLSAFTMAEILLSLTIIGVVAAITLPSLTGNINERTWNTQRKALYARMSQAIALMPALNGYGTLKEESSSGAGDAVDTAAETFVTNGLAKVLKINNICDNEHLEDCGLPETITPLNAESIIKLNEISSLRGFNSLFTSEAGIPLDIKAAAFETQMVKVYWFTIIRTVFHISTKLEIIIHNPKCALILFMI